MGQRRRSPSGRAGRGGRVRLHDRQPDRGVRAHVGYNLRLAGCLQIVTIHKFLSACIDTSQHTHVHLAPRPTTYKLGHSRAERVWLDVWKHRIYQTHGVPSHVGCEKLQGFQTRIAGMHSTSLQPTHMLQQQSLRSVVHDNQDARLVFLCPGIGPRKAPRRGMI